MKTTINLTIHAPSKKAAKECLEHLLWAWDRLRKSGDAPINTFLGVTRGPERSRKWQK